MVAILALGSWFIIQGQLTVGTLVAFLSLLLNFNRPLETLLSLGSNLQQIRGDVLRINDVLKYPIDKPAEIEKLEKENLAGQLTLREIDFGYSELAGPLIRDFNLCLTPGENIAIIGKTGSGKSTLSKLMMNLYQPWVGEVLIDNINVSRLDPEIIANTIALVEQDIFLFAGTIRENLTLWDTSIDDEVLYEAIALAHMDDELLARGGLNCLVLEAGTNFSGGQRQRLEIARALVRKPNILILDEATAALDPPMEKNIFDSLRKTHITVIIITHRLSAIRDCDEIIMLDKGSIIDRGTHEELLRHNVYKKLVGLEQT